jgi:hypothetical protein
VTELETPTTKRRPSAADLLERGTGYLTRTHLRELGLERRAVDSVFRTIAKDAGVVVLAGYSRPLIRVEDFLELVARSTHRDDGGSVWP